MNDSISVKLTCIILLSFLAVIISSILAKHDVVTTILISIIMFADGVITGIAITMLFKRSAQDN